MKIIFFIIFLSLTKNIFASTGTNKTIVFLGDSLTEGYGLAKEKAYPQLVKELFKSELQKDIEIINGGVSGSTTSDGLSRLKWFIKKKPDILLLALGANDGLRGLKISQTKNNLIEIINFAQENKIKVLMAGMLMPPNYGPDYTDSFKNMYLEIKKEKNIPTMPFVLQSVAGKKEFNQKDGIHPNEEGQKIVAKEIFSFLKDHI